MLLSAIVLQTFLVIAFYYDVRYQIIPNKLNLMAMISGFVISISYKQWTGMQFSLYGLLIGFGLTLLLYFWRAIAAGDVKCFAAAGSFLGAEQNSILLLLSIFVAGIIALIVWLKKRSIKGMTMPFMFAMLPASIYVIWM